MDGIGASIVTDKGSFTQSGMVRSGWNVFTPVLTREGWRLGSLILKRRAFSSNDDLLERSLIREPFFGRSRLFGSLFFDKQQFHQPDGLLRLQFAVCFINVSTLVHPCRLQTMRSQETRI